MTAKTPMVEYYARRAAEYEDVYRKPERQSDLIQIRKMLATAFAGMDVLEVACGTGYWTECIAESARKITASDINEEMLEIARLKDYGPCSVSFTKADAYSLDGVPAGCTAGFRGFWWSHVPRQRIADFLQGFHARLPSGARVVMIDNAYVEGGCAMAVWIMLPARKQLFTAEMAKGAFLNGARIQVPQAGGRGGPAGSVLQGYRGARDVSRRREIPTVLRGVRVATSSVKDKGHIEAPKTTPLANPPSIVRLRAIT